MSSPASSSGCCAPTSPTWSTRIRAGSCSAIPPTGEPLGWRRLYERLREALTAARLDPAFGFHSLRHSYGTALAAQGVPMRTLQEWMGHRDIQTTQRYADYCPNPGERDVVEAAFARKVPIEYQTARDESQLSATESK